ncbi:MAG: hypothetical protein GPJ54_03505 [Candidatus Heimdallarchaeota archaeon]|nr:hypothetical protein [Candidatus Heimdallarchaeota archaeon]
MDVLHIIGKNLEKLDAKSGNEYEFLDGDVYVIDNGNTIWIWRGKDCGVDEQTVGAWVANKLDNTDRGGEPAVYSVIQGDESDELKGVIQISVLDGDTPGFLKHAELDTVEYKLWRVYTKEETATMDQAYSEEVNLSRDSLKSEDVFVLDGNDNLYLWVGGKANREEKFEGQKLMQKIDSGRSYLPLQYTIYENENTKSEKAFYDFLSKAKGAGPVISVEDQRELEYRPEKSQTSEEHKSTATDHDSRDKKATSAPKKKPWWKFW